MTIAQAVQTPQGQTCATAWQPATSLHPTIAPHATLAIDPADD